MASGRPFFPGSCVEEQLHFIFRALGTPRAEEYPELVGSKEFRQYSFPKYRAEAMVNHAPRLDVDGLDLLSKLLQVRIFLFVDGFRARLGCVAIAVRFFDGGFDFGVWLGWRRASLAPLNLP